MNSTTRFSDIEPTSRILPSVTGYFDYPLLPLQMSLEPVLPLIANLDNYIRLAEQNCNQSLVLLTRDESASIYIYTMEWGDQSLYRVLNKTLRSENRHALTPWFSYLKLFNTALGKLPSLKMNLWRGVYADVSSGFKKDDKFTWWSISSCSSSVDIIKTFLGPQSTLFLIEAVNGKSVAEYTSFPHENEVLLVHGTCLHVVSNVLDHPNGMHVVHLRECQSQMPSDPPKPSISSNPTSTLFQPSSFLLQSTVTKKRILYPSGDIYDGEILNHLYHGYGMYTWKNGDRYEGNWANNRREGQGVWIWGDQSSSAGDRYSGQWHLDKKHGYGEYTQANGDAYEGEFKDDKRDGDGIYRMRDGGECSNVTYNQDELVSITKISNN